MQQVQDVPNSRYFSDIVRISFMMPSPIAKADCARIAAQSRGAPDSISLNGDRANLDRAGRFKAG
jgi:hypothetical protein